MAVIALRHALTSAIYGVRAPDVTVLGGLTAGLAIVALLAMVIPDRRAANVRPAAVLE